GPPVGTRSTRPSAPPDADGGQKTDQPQELPPAAVRGAATIAVVLDPDGHARRFTLVAGRIRRASDQIMRTVADGVRVPVELGGRMIHLQSVQLRVVDIQLDRL